MYECLHCVAFALSSQVKIVCVYICIIVQHETGDFVLHNISKAAIMWWTILKDIVLHTKATTHEVIIMVATSMNVLVPSHSHLLTTDADDLILWLSPERQCWLLSHSVPRHMQSPHQQSPLKH